MVAGSQIELAIGNPFGVEVYILNFWEGLGPDIVLAIFYWLNSGQRPVLGWKFALIAGIASTSLGAPYTLITRGLAALMRNFTGYGEWAFALFMANRVLGGVICGAAALAISRTLHSMGVVRSGEGYRVVES
jgi:ABC-type thiamin/hydroxymethylpyrimidine transport system permease subunit